MTHLSWAYFRSGLADNQIVGQFTQEFDAYVAVHSPTWGNVVIAAGMEGQIFEPPQGDINLYWWWSGSEPGRGDWLAHYHAHASIRPAAVLCTSLKEFDHARECGYKVLYLAMAAGRDYYPLTPPLPRTGIGFCGTPGHMEAEQMALIVEPARAYGLEWLVEVQGGRPELNRKYNSWAVCLRMTAARTLAWGIVPNRTFDVLATGSPYVTSNHPAMNDALGFEYPYQAATSIETHELIREFIHNWEAHRLEFLAYSRIVQRYHTWANRMRALARFIDEEL